MWGWSTLARSTCLFARGSIRTAIRRQLETRASAVDDSVARRALTLGTQHYSRSDLEEVREEAAPLSSASWASRASRTTSLSTSHHDRVRRGPRGLPGAAGGQGGTRPAHGVTDKPAASTAASEADTALIAVGVDNS
jgi:hypothetical protein